jgi:hypothetical protein
MVPHDGSEMSDKALSHAAYLSKICRPETILEKRVAYIFSH